MLVPDADWGRSGRVDSYECRLVDPFTLADKGPVAIDPRGSSVTWALYTETKASATIAVLDDLAKDSMLRLRHVVEVGGERYAETMGTFFAASKSMKALHGRASRSMDCYSTLLRHSKDYLQQVHTYAPGDNVSAIIREIVEADGGVFTLGPGAPTDSVHTMDMHWEAGVNKLEMVEKLAGWIGGELSATDAGEVQLSAYVAPSARPVSWTFEAGRNCIYRPGFVSSEDEGEAYNKAVFWTSTDEESASAAAVLAPTHPFSYERIGRHVTYVERVGEAMPREELQAKAAGWLEEHCGGAVYYEIEHAGVPGLRPGMAVRYVNRGDYAAPVDSLCLVTEMACDELAPMCMTRTKMRSIG